MNEAYLCLGGNLGNCEKNFAKALKMLERRAIRTIGRSHVYTSEPWCLQNVPDFYNEVVLIKTNHSASQLMQIILETEEQLGRKRIAGEVYSSRIIDIDILFFNDEIIKMPSLIVPHPRCHLRKFVLVPMKEIAPGFIHPLLHKTISQLLDACEDQSRVSKLIHA